jgi:hypothetical protein
MDSRGEKYGATGPTMKKIELFVATPHEHGQDIVFGGEEEEEWKLGDGKEPCAGSAKLPHVPAGTIPARLALDTSCASFVMHTRSVVRYPRRTMTVMGFGQDQPARCRLTSNG